MRCSAFPRLKALIAEHAEEGSIGNFLMEELHSFVGDGWEQEDDITLLTLERHKRTGAIYSSLLL